MICKLAFPDGKHSSTYEFIHGAFAKIWFLYSPLSHAVGRQRSVLAEVPDWPNTTIVNQYGGLDFEHDRVVSGRGKVVSPHSRCLHIALILALERLSRVLAHHQAFIDGSDDPWLYATPHSPDAKTRSSTDLRPYELINGGVHHWDENGLSNRSSLHREPDEIRRIHAREIDFVRAWLLSAKA